LVEVKGWSFTWGAPETERLLLEAITFSKAHMPSTRIKLFAKSHAAQVNFFKTLYIVFLE